VLATAAAVTCTGAPANAAIAHKLLGQVTEVPATGPHGEPIANHGPLSEVGAIAVDSGDLLIADGSRLDSFSAASGAFESQISSSTGLGRMAGVAVGHATGEAVTYLGGLLEEPGFRAGAVDVFGESGALLARWKGAHTPSGSFGGPGPLSVAVDNDTGNLSDWASGDVFVATNTNSEDREIGEVDIFKPEAGGREPAKLVGSPLTGTCASTGTCPGKELPFRHLRAIAVDQANGELFLVAGEPTGVEIFKQGPLTGEYEFVGRVTETPSGPLSPRAVAVDSGAVDGGDVYVTSEKGFVDEFKLTSSGESLEYVGRLPGNEGAVAVDPTDGDLYAGGDRYGPDLIEPDVTVTEPPLDVTTTGATLRGTANPAAGGEATCEFEYGTSASYGEHAKCTKSIPEGNTPVAEESTRVTGLQPDTTYDYRLDATTLADGATNTGEAPEDLGTFTTAGPGLEGEWAADVASTSATLAATIDPNNGLTSYRFQYGTKTAYEDETPSEAIGSGATRVGVRGMHLDGLAPSTVYHYRLVVLSEVLAEVSPGRFEPRVEAFYGSDQTFTTQNTGGTFVLPDGRGWELVSPADKHGAHIEPPGEEALTTQAAAEGDAVTYNAIQPTESQPLGNVGAVQVLSTREPGGGWVSQDLATPHDAPATFFNSEYPLFSPNLADAVIEPQFSRLLALSPSASEATPYLRAGLLAGDPGGQCAEGCYTPLVTGCPPQGTPCPRAVEEYADVAPGTEFGGRPATDVNKSAEYAPRFAGASSDLSYVLLESWAQLTPGATGPGVYLWSAGKPPSERLAHVACTNEAEDEPGVFENATERVIPPLFTCHPASNGTEAFDTEVFDVAQPGEPVPLAGKLEGIGPGARVFFGGGQECEAKVGGSGKVECVVVPGPGVELAGKSRDGSYVYGYSRAVLSAAPNGDGEKAVAGAENLYVTHHNGGAWEESKFITGLAAGRVTVSPSGRWMTFNSVGEEYLYSVERETVACASCNPTGVRQTSRVSAPRPDAYLLHEGYYQPRYLSDRGQVFFDTAEALVPKDVNGQTDVYEYEPEGVGSCTSATASGSVAYSAQAKGCIGLLSSGESSRESLFIDASESGGDVFIFTDDKLVPQDGEGSYSVYDAHECTAAAPCPTSTVQPPPCTTSDSCKPAPTPQPAIYGAPASATFSGAGNVTAGVPSTSPRACPKDRTLRKGNCVKSKKRRKKPKRAGKARRPRKAGRNGKERRGRS
jgi:hypothetical protein